MKTKNRCNFCGSENIKAAYSEKWGFYCSQECRDFEVYNNGIIMGIVTFIVSILELLLSGNMLTILGDSQLFNNWLASNLGNIGKTDVGVSRRVIRVFLRPRFE